MEVSIKMEPNEAEPDVNNLIDNFAGLGFREAGPFHGVPIVIFDIDTTNGDRNNSEICQIAAWCKYNTFNIFMLPARGISQHARNNNGFSIVGGTLRHYGNEVNALPPEEGLERFLDFLETQKGQTHGVLLAAHGCFSYRLHRYVLVRLMRNYYKLFETFQSLVLGFIDTYPIFERILTERAEQVESFSLQNLATYYLGENAFPEKHAVVNVEIVSLIVIIECSDAMLAQRAESLDEFIQFIELYQVFGNVLNTYMLNKIAQAGITFGRLEEEYTTNGAEGVSNFLHETVAGQIAKKLELIDKINSRLRELFGDGNAN